MLDIRYIEKERDTVVEQLEARQLVDAAQLVEKAIASNKQRKALQAVSDRLKHGLKQRASSIAACLKAGDIGASDLLKKEVALAKIEYKKALASLKTAEKTLHDALLHLPNLMASDVPRGKGVEANREVALWDPEDRVNRSSSDLKPHWELLAQYQLASFEQGVKIAGAGFPVYMGKGAQLQRALINFFLDEGAACGYEENWLPAITNSASAIATGQLPDKEGMMYKLKDGDAYLIPTGEVPLTNLYRDTLLRSGDLPRRHMAYTPCFRREAGSWGRHVRGLNRLHQFDKVEIVEVVSPAMTDEAFQRMCKHVATLLEKLGLTYRILSLCSGDLGFTSEKTYDFEVYSPGQQRWLEVSSVGSFNSYQARRLNLRYQTKQGQRAFCHTLNGSALALPRTLAALLETYQTSSGIVLPSVLHAYTTFTTIT